MNAGADVGSLAALHDWYAALAEFRTEAQGALTSLALSLQRAEHWLGEQAQFWRRRIRACEEDVTQAKTELMNRQYADFSGDTPDCTVLMKELYKAGYTGAKVAQGYAVNQKLLDSMPAEVSDGTYIASPSPAVESAGYKRLAKFLGASDLDPYSCQCHDHISLVALAIARAKGEATGTAVRDTVRKVSQGSGTKVDSGPVDLW